MTVSSATRAEMPAQLSLQDRRKILGNVLGALQKRFYSPEKLNGDWQAAVDRHRQMIEESATADSFEQSMSDLLTELKTSHLLFFHSSVTCTPGSAQN